MGATYVSICDLYVVSALWCYVARLFADPGMYQVMNDAVDADPARCIYMYCFVHILVHIFVSYLFVYAFLGHRSEIIIHI